MNSRQSAMPGSRVHEDGIALLVALIALLIFSVIGLYLALVATAEVRISDNFESYHRARNAALAGLNHGRALLRGLRFDDQLQGPDGIHDMSPANIAFSRTYSYRMPVAFSLARMMDILDPASALPNVSDDGILNSGKHPGGNGMALIPLTGIAFMISNPNGPGLLAGARYFVKASDNNGEASELALDPANDPFLDGDGQIILRSTGIAGTLGESMAAGIRSNTVGTFEARFKRFSTFELDAPVVVQSSDVSSAGTNMFSGSDFLIQGGSAAPGIATIDPSTGDGIEPAQQILSRLAPVQANCPQGAGGPPSIQDITSLVSANRDKRLLLDEAASWRFLRTSLPQFADNRFSGAQNWIGASPASLGSYDPALPSTSPGQDPRVTYVDGDLLVDGSLEGAGLLAVTGRTTIKGNFAFNGLILIIGAGELDVGGWAVISGGILVARLSNVNGILSWGTARFSIGDSSRILYNRELIRMAVNLIPPAGLSLREITGVIDP